MTSRSADNQIWIVRANHGDPISADDFAERVADGLGERVAVRAIFSAPFFVAIADEVREDFGVGVGFEFVSGLEQLLFERVVIFNDTVVDDGDPAGLVEMRVAIFVRRNSVRGPARVADAEIPRERSGFQQRRETFVNLPLFFSREQFSVPHHDKPGTVVTAISQPPQSFEDDGRGRFFPDVSDDAAHNFFWWGGAAAPPIFLCLVKAARQRSPTLKSTPPFRSNYPRRGRV